MVSRRMRVLITASGIQDYIFGINAQSAGARLRGRSAQLGLAIDYCFACLNEQYPGQFEIVRDAGSRLEVEFPHPPTGLEVFLDELRHRLDVFRALGFAARSGLQWLGVTPPI